MFRRYLLLAALAFAAAVTPATAEVVEIPGVVAGFPIPPHFVLKAAGVNFDRKSAYIWVDAEGNCRWDYKQVCWTDKNGQTHCRTEREWVCQEASSYYRLPTDKVTVDKGAKRAFYHAPGAAPLAFGKVKSFLWTKWIQLFDGAGLDVGYDAASLRLDTDALQGGVEKDQFRELYDGQVE